MSALVRWRHNDVKLCIPIDTGLEIAEKYKEISNNQTT